ncbi:MFS transporter [Nonomuraea rubra]|uniref:MFS transporter n=1 Tax=Nonomuraea rubra TaxID=46180 RepID=UPI0036181527
MNTQTQEAVPKPSGLLLAIILVGQFLAILNVNIVNVATPTIEADLNASGAGLQMIVAGYTIVYAVLLITGARVGDLFGYRKAFLGGLAVFTITTLAAGLAPATGWLVASRLLQGAGAAMMMPQVLTLIQRNYHGAARGRAIGLWSLVISGGIVVGQALGGILLGLGLGWRLVFLTLVPIGALLLVAGLRVLPADEGGGRTGLDPLGLATLSAAVLLFVVPLVLGRDLGWPVWGWVSMGLSVVTFAAFVRIERWVTARGGRPLVDARVLRAPGMRPGLAILLFGPATWGRSCSPPPCTCRATYTCRRWPPA